MPGATVNHGTFTVEREYPHPPQTVFAAWTTAEAKRGWFAQGDDFLRSVNLYELDFRVGGVERLEGELTSGNRLTLETIYRDIVQNERIVAAYDVLINDQRLSVSLFSVQLMPTEVGTRLITTEHGAFLDDLDTPESRTTGVERDLDQLALYLERTVLDAA
jgi:uncharacterized protein YndB with AHSA1/START domain